MCPKVTSQYKTEVREKIVHAAIIAFSKYGYDRTRMDDIADTAKLSKGTLYLYFKSKEEISFMLSLKTISEISRNICQAFIYKKRGSRFRFPKVLCKFSQSL